MGLRIIKQADNFGMYAKIGSDSRSQSSAKLSKLLG